MRTPALDIPALLRRYGLRPDKRLGQNFLIDEAALEKVVESAGVEPQDVVLEIGPGLGSLTRHLAERARRVVAVELDDRLEPPLREALASYSNVRLVFGDILAQNPSELLSGAEESGQGYLVVANIPYYITSAVIRHLLEAPLRPRRLALTVQKEVAQRLVARPGDLSLLALSVQVYGAPVLVARIPAEAFYPPPKVDSSVVRVDLYADPQIEPALLPAFFRWAKAGFSQKRKTLRNALSAGLARSPAEIDALLRQAGIDPMRRAETLSLDEWRTLVKQSS